MPGGPWISGNAAFDTTLGLHLKLRKPQLLVTESSCIPKSRGVLKAKRALIDRYRQLAGVIKYFVLSDACRKRPSFRHSSADPATPSETITEPSPGGTIQRLRLASEPKIFHKCCQRSLKKLVPTLQELPNCDFMHIKRARHFVTNQKPRDGEPQLSSRTTHVKSAMWMEQGFSSCTLSTAISPLLIPKAFTMLPLHPEIHCLAFETVDLVTQHDGCTSSMPIPDFPNAPVFELISCSSLCWLLLFRASLLASPTTYPYRLARHGTQ